MSFPCHRNVVRGYLSGTGWQQSVTRDMASFDKEAWQIIVDRDALQSLKRRMSSILRSNFISTWPPVSQIRASFHDILFVWFWTAFTFLVKSQYTSQLKTLSLKCGECYYFDISSLNEERYGMVLSYIFLIYFMLMYPKNFNHFCQVIDLRNYCWKPAS